MNKILYSLPAFKHSNKYIISYIKELCKDNIEFECREFQDSNMIYVKTSADRDKFKKILLKEFNEIITNLKKITESHLNEPPFYIQ